MRSLRTCGGSAPATCGTQRKMNIATSSRPISKNGSIMRGKQAAAPRIVDGSAKTSGAAGTKVQGIGDHGRVLWCLRRTSHTATGTRQITIG